MWLAQAGAGGSIFSLFGVIRWFTERPWKTCLHGLLLGPFILSYSVFDFIFFLIKTCEAGLVLSVTRGILRAALAKFRVHICVCNSSSQTTEPICIKIIPANRASYADCYRLLRFEIFTKHDEYCPRERIFANDSVGEGIMFSGCRCPPAAFVRLFVRTDLVTTHDISWTAWAISMKLRESIREPPLMIWVDFGGQRSRSRQAVEASKSSIHVDAIGVKVHLV